MSESSATRSKTFAALKFRNYRLFAAGSFLSNIGTWLQRVAQDWLVLALTGSAGALGITTGLQFLPTLLFSPFAGVLADRYAKKVLLNWTQAIMGVTALVMGVLAVTGTINVWQVYVLTFVFGTASRPRRAGPPGVRQRDGRRRAPVQRRRAELGVVQPGPHDRPGAGRRADRADGLRASPRPAG